jgi:hypothetical protein
MGLHGRGEEPRLDYFFMLSLVFLPRISVLIGFSLLTWGLLHLCAWLMES